MSATKKMSNERVKVKKKMSKVEMQQAIIKKKQCDAKALAIVEQLLEPNVNSDWLIQNLKFINKEHMEDVIEERSIVKLCGYVLCSKPLTVIVKQQYRISTRTNKVYDISKRKKFCSSLCYGASNYLLEQMLESPLWLREKEDIPVFRILPINSMQSLPGDEIDIMGANLSQSTDTDDINKNKEPTELNTTIPIKSHLSTAISSLVMEDGSHLANDANVAEHIQVEIPINIETLSLHETHLSELCTNQEDKEIFQNCTNYENVYSDHIREENMNSENLETQTAIQSNSTLYTHERVDINKENENVNSKIISSNNYMKILQPRLDEVSDKKNDNSIISQSQLEVSNSHNSKDVRTVKFQSDNRAYSSDQTTAISSEPSSETRNKPKKMKDSNRKKSKHQQKESDNTETQASVYCNLMMHVEQSFRQWITKKTLCLLLGEADEKSQLLENLTQQDRYEQLCKKLNRLQLQEEKEDRIDMEKNVLNPMPHLSVLQEEGKKIELKIRAFYDGRMTITEPSKNESNNENEGEEPVLPLTTAHAPNALRRRIFLEKLNKVLPDLLCALTQLPGNTSTSVRQRICDNDTYSLIKLLVSTFHLTATNIVFKTAEWTLVGLIIIKMLSLVDTQLQLLLGSKQASMYTSMILMSYKLDSGYLDRLVMDVINKNASEL